MGHFQEYLIYCPINSEVSWKWSEERSLRAGVVRMRERGAGVSKGVDPVGIQNKRPQHVPQWYADFFELKATLATG